MKKSFLILFALLLPLGVRADSVWKKNQANDEKTTKEYLKKFPKVGSQRFIFKEIKTSSGETLVLDLKIEKPKSGEGPFPVVFYVHGGAWATGSKAHFIHQSFSLADKGIAGVRMEYRLIRHGGNFKNVFPDVMDAVDFIRKKSRELNLDFTRVGLAGGSAGGHLSSLVAQATPECIGYDGFNGLFDAFERNGSAFGGGPFTGESEKEKKSASAIYQIRKNPPDTFLYHGSEDVTITAIQSERFAEAIRKKGGNAEVLIYEGVGHSFFGKIQAHKDITTKALYDHVSYVFGMNKNRPKVKDYALPPHIAKQIPEFDIQGDWLEEKKKKWKLGFLEKGLTSTKGTVWEKRYGSYYIKWKGGTQTKITIISPTKIKIRASVMNKVMK